MKVLSDKKYAEVVTWMPSGKSFNIINSKRFVAEVLPEHFKNAKYSSFTRKLHRWGFIRHYRGEEAGAFFHTNFHKDRFDMVEKMTCYKQDPPKAVGAFAAPNPSKSPSVDAESYTHVAVPVVAAPVSLMGQNQAPTGMQSNSGQQCSDLNVAIEREVARRVRERLDVAAMNRAQTMALMQHEQQMIQEQELRKRQEQQLLQQQQERQMFQQQQERQFLQQEQHIKASGLLSNHGGHLPWSKEGIELLKRSMMPALRQDLLQSNYKPLLYPTRASNVDPPFQAMPQKNLYSAKTA
jgi:hypothetical protein